MLNELLYGAGLPSPAVKKLRLSDDGRLVLPKAKAPPRGAPAREKLSAALYSGEYFLYNNVKAGTILFERCKTLKDDTQTPPRAAKPDNPHAGHRKRLRGDYIERGIDGMREHQALELLLTFAIPRADTNALAHRLLSREHFGSLAGVLSADVDSLMRVEGVGESAAVLLSLAGSLSRKCAVGKREALKLDTPDAALRFCAEAVPNCINERVYVLTLDRGSRLLHMDMISSGTPGEAAVYPRTVVECATRRGGESVILCHNHPSGDVRPSREDLEMTRRVMDALTPIGISLNDHIIIGGGNAFSMKMNAELSGESAHSVLAEAAQRKE